MSRTVRSLAFATTLAAAMTSSALAQPVAEEAYVVKRQLFEQVSADQVQLLPAKALPFVFEVSIYGTEIGDLAPAPSIDGPISNPEPGNNGGVLGYNAGDDRWAYGFPEFQDWGVATLAELNDLFGDGTYTITADGLTIPLELVGAAFPSAPPSMALSGGAWVGGEYRIAPGSELTITSSTYAEYGTNAEDVIFLGVFGENYDQEVEAIASENPGSDSVSLTVPADTLKPGSFDIACGFAGATDFLVGVPGSPDFIAAAAYEIGTTIRLVVTTDPLPELPVETVAVVKARMHTQTSATDVDLLPAEDLPFSIDIFVEGPGPDDLGSAPVVIGPISNPNPGHNDGVLGYDAEDESWRYGFPDFVGWSTETQEELDALFGSGDYSIAIEGLDIPLPLFGDLYPAMAPRVILEGGEWVNGVYVVASDADLGASTSVYTEYGDDVENLIYLELYFDGGFIDGLEVRASVDPDSDSIGLGVPADTLLPGFYTFEVAFIGASSFQTGVPGLPSNALAATGYESVTRLLLEVVEPAPPCPADLDGDGMVGFSDLLLITSSWNGGPGPSDIDGDGTVGFGDLLLALGAWGPCDG